jgi:queuine/archaeosine tRNA-ribosyltransferase
MKKTTKSKIRNRKSKIQNPQSTKAYIECLAQLKKQKESLQRLLTVIEETETEILTKTNLFTLYDIQRTIRNEIKTQVVESNDDFLKSVFADVLDGTGETIM